MKNAACHALMVSCLTSGGADIAGADREDLEQLERAVRGRLLEMQILKLAAQCRASESQFAAYLDVASTTARPKVSLLLMFAAVLVLLGWVHPSWAALQLILMQHRSTSNLGNTA